MVAASVFVIFSPVPLLPLAFPPAMLKRRTSPKPCAHQCPSHQLCTLRGESCSVPLEIPPKLDQPMDGGGSQNCLAQPRARSGLPLAPSLVALMHAPRSSIEY